RDHRLSFPRRRHGDTRAAARNHRLDPHVAGFSSLLRHMDSLPTRRRDLFKLLGAGLLTVGGARLVGSRMLDVALGGGWRGEILVVVFLRGGYDGLSLVPPFGGNDRALYDEARPSLRVPESGDKAALRLDDRFGLHPAARPLFDLYRDRKLAIVHAAG